jgi:hypothetical protein
MRRAIALSSAFLVAVMCAVADVRAQTVEVAPFVGIGFGGSLASPVLDEAFSIKSGANDGVTVEVPVGPPVWRFEARGFYTPVTSGGGAICSNGRCTFAYSGSGVFQGDVSGAVVFAF